MPSNKKRARDSDSRKGKQQPTEKHGQTHRISSTGSSNQLATPADSDGLHKVTVYQLDSGVQYQDVVVGSGPQASFRRPVSVRYKGMLTSGVVFDTNMPRGNPLKFVIGAGDVVPGFEQGVSSSSSY